MSIEAGQELLHYRLIEKIGEGGMGVVWKAVDTELDREVAIKVLPEMFAADAERLARFRREAKLLASLNHPNIAAVYGLHEAEGVRFLAMELVGGEDLAERIQRGPLPVEDAVGVGKQIAAALEAAHGQGVIHRDLKPANVLLAADGGVKVLDFGLAKALEPGGAGSDPSLSPTMTSEGTQAGMILGTAAYMSPEQAKGRLLDRRSDIWSFGVTLLEMLTGVSPYKKDTVPETLAEVLKGTPDLRGLPPATPPALRRLLERCLVKDAAWRLADMGDARIELRAAAEEEPEPGQVVPAAAGSNALTWVFAAVALLSIATAIWLALRPAPTREPLSLEITLPRGQTIEARPAISPDGRTVAYEAFSNAGGRQLYLRDLSEFEPRLVGHASGTGGPFFSPDGSEVGFFSNGRIWKVAVSGGSPTPLVDTPQMFGGTWAADGSIVWAPGLNAGLHRLAPGSTTAERLTQPDSGVAGYAHVLPQALPDGRVLYTRWGETEENNYILDLETGESTPVRGSRLTEQSTAVYAPGHLLVGDRQTGLKLAPLDLRASAVTGPARSVASGVFWHNGIFLSSAAVSANGTMVYLPGDPSRRRLVWFDRTGRVAPAIEAEQNYSFPELSPDGRRVALTVMPDVVVLDLERGTQTRITAYKSDHLSFRPQWMPDGKRVLFASNASGRWDLYVRNADATGEIEPLVDWEPTAWPLSFSSDGVLLMTSPNPETGMDLWMLKPGGEPEPYLVTPFGERSGRISPDGTLVAYSSNSSGRWEVYVQSFPEPGERQVISTAGGVAPAWSPDGARLYYVLEGAMWEVAVTRSPSLRFGQPVRLFSGDFEATNWERFVVAAGEDGDRFLMVQPLPESITDRLHVVVGWGDEVGL